MDRRKIYLISGIILLSCIFAWVAFASLPGKKGNETKEVSLRTNIQEEFTVNDMVTSQDGKRETASENASDPSHPVFLDEEEDPEAISRIQALIRENERTALQHAAIADKEDKEESDQNYPRLITPEEVLAMQQNLEAKLNNSHPKKEKKKKEEKTTPIPEPVAPKSRFNSVVLQKKVTRNAIKAYVHSEQIVQEGATLKMRIAEDCYTDDGVAVKKNASIYGMVKKIDGERVIVDIQTVNISGNILPFKREVYSKDAIEGIWVPGNAKAETAKDIESGVVDGVSVPISGGMGVGSQIVSSAANAAVSGGKGALSKQVKKVKVTIKTNYEIYLMIPENKNTASYEEE